MNKLSSVSAQFSFSKLCKHPLIDILKLFQTMKPPKDPASDASSEFLKMCKIPSIDRQQILAVSLILSQNTKQIEKILQPVANLFLFDELLLKLYVTNFSGTYDLIPLTCVIAFLSSEDCSKFENSFPILLTACTHLTSAVPKDLKNFCIGQVVKKFMNDTGKCPEFEIVQNIFTDCDANLFDVLVEIVWHSQEAQTREYIVSLLWHSMENNPDSFFECNFASFLKFLSEDFARLDLSAMKLLHVMMRVKIDSHIMSTICSFPRIVVDNVHEDFTIPEIHQRKVMKCEKCYDYTFDFEIDDTFPDGLCPLSSKKFDDVDDIEGVVPSSYFEMAEYLANSWSDWPMKCRDLFIESFAKLLSESERDYKSLVMFVLVLVKLNGNVPSAVLSVLLNSVLFDSSVSIMFESDEASKVVLPIRMYFVDYLLRECPASVPLLFNGLEDNPILFAGIVARVHSKLHLLDVSMFLECIGPLTRTTANLWRLYQERRNDDDIMYIQTARTTLFLFLSKILEDKAISLVYFSSWHFVCCYLARVLESSLRRPILSSFSRFLVNYSDEACITPSFQLMAGVFDISRSTKQDVDEALPLDILQVITESAVINQSLVHVLSPLVGHVTAYLVARPSFAFLSQTLRFISVLSVEQFVFSPSQIQQLSAGVRMIEGNDPSHETISSILGTISVSKSINPDLSSMFVIVNPSPILLLFSIVRSKEWFKQLLEFMMRLCKYSTSNCLQCHRGELDLLLLEMIGATGDEFRFRGCTFNSFISEEVLSELVIPLIAEIASLVSSPVVATKLLLLIAPNQDESFSEHSLTILNMMNSVACTNNRFRARQIPLECHGPLFISDPIPRSSVENGITINTWIKIDTALSQTRNIKQEIVSLKYDEHNRIVIELNGDTVICRLFSAQEVKTAVLLGETPSCEWIMLTVVFQRMTKENNDLLHFAFYLNGEFRDKYCVNYPEPSGSVLKMSIGTPINNPLENVYPGYLSSVLLYGVAMESESITCCYGPVHQVDTVMNPICGYPSNNSHAVRLIENVCPTKILSLSESLSKENVFSIFILFFAYIESMPNLFLALLLDVMGSVIEVGSCDQLNYDIFAVIGHLLRRTKSSELTYSLYTRFFALSDRCCDSLASSLTKNILANFGLWSSSEQAQLMRIIGHWNSALPHICDEMNDIGYFCALIRMYFWYTPVERNVINSRPYPCIERDPLLDISQVRQALDKFIITLSGGSLSRDNSLSLLYHASVCRDDMQVLNFLNLFGEIGCRERDVVKYLLFFLKPKSEELFITALKTIYRTTNVDLFFFIDSVVSAITVRHCTAKLLELCIEMIEEYPLIFPVMLRISLSLGKESMVKAAVALKLIKRTDFKLILENRLWSLWPVILGCHLPRTQLREVIFFVCSVLMEDLQLEQLQNVMGILDILKLSALSHVDDFESELLTVIVTLNVASEQPVKKGLFKFCLKTILLHRIPEFVLPALSALYEESPYAETHPDSVSASGSMSSLAVEAKTSARFPVCDTSSGVLLVKKKEPQKQSGIFARPRSGANAMKRRISSSFSQYQFTGETDNDLTTLEGSDDLLSLLKKRGDDARYTFGVRLPIDSEFTQSFLEMTLELGESVPLKGKYTVIIAYLRNILGNVRILPSKDLEESMSVYYKKASEKWTSFCLSTKKVVYRHYVDVDSALQTVLRNMRSENISANEAVAKCIAVENQAKNKCLKESKMILRTVAHSWKDITFKYRRSFRHTPWFSQVKVTREPQFRWKTAQMGFRLGSVCDCQVVHVGGEIHTKFHVLKDRIVLEGYASIDASQIWCILKRFRIQKKTCLEFFLLNGRSHLVDFAPKSASSVIKELKSVKMENCVYLQKCGFRKMIKAHGKTNDWVERRISNFEYILHLNMFASRSFHDAGLYPIFPWTLATYNSSELDLKDEKNFRNFKYPIFAQTEEQRRRLSLKMDYSSPVTSDNAMSFIAPSNPVVVAHWLLRMQPFTDVHREIEDGKFGIPARLFRSIEIAYQQAIESGSNWELTPEFYCAPEFLENLNNENMGDGINHVVPPEWAATNYEFVYKHRKALESDYFSEHLHEWIDLIFGVTSVGEKAIDVFHVLCPLLYSDVWKKPSAELSDPSLIVSTLQKSGQMPPQIFESSHPVRSVRQSQANQTVIQDSLPRGSIVASAVVKYDSKSIRFLNLLAGGVCLSCVVKYLSDGVKTDSKLVESKIDVTECVCTCESGIAVVSENRYCSISAKGVCKAHEFPLALEFACSDGVNVSYCTRDGEVWFVKDGNFESRRCICSIYYEKPAVIATNTDFDLLVVGTFSESVLFYSLSSGLFRVKANIPEETAQRILITPAWGFVLVQTSKHLCLFSVNGMLLKQIDFTMSISAWGTWRSVSGFDYLAIADNKGSIYLMEVFEMDLGKPIYFCCGKPVSVSYLSDISRVLVVTFEGKYHLIPYSHDC